MSASTRLSMMARAWSDGTSTFSSAATQKRLSAVSEIRTVFSSLIASTFEDRLGQAARADIEREQRTRMRRPGHGLGAQIERRRGHVEHVQIRSAESAARRPRHGEADHAIDASVRGEARDAPAVEMRYPEIAVDVDGSAVGNALVLGEAREDAAIGNRAGTQVEIVGVDLARPGIGGVEDAVVGTERGAVAHGQSVDHARAAPVRIETVERGEAG